MFWHKADMQECDTPGPHHRTVLLWTFAWITVMSPLITESCDQWTFTYFLWERVSVLCHLEYNTKWTINKAQIWKCGKHIGKSNTQRWFIVWYYCTWAAWLAYWREFDTATTTPACRWALWQRQGTTVHSNKKYNYLNKTYKVGWHDIYRDVSETLLTLTIREESWEWCRKERKTGSLYEAAWFKFVLKRKEKTRNFLYNTRIVK